jgi:hypothetical protein
VNFSIDQDGFFYYLKDFIHEYIDIFNKQYP